MDLLREFFDYIADGLGLVKAQEIHCGHFPPEGEDTCAVMLDVGGTDSQPILRGNVGEAMFQVLVRGQTYRQAEILAYRIHDFLVARPGANLGGHQAWAFDAVARPQFLPIEERMRFELSTTYIVRFTDEAAFAAA